MMYSFDVDIAHKIGVDEAIMVSNFQFWISKNKANNQALHDGRYWTYNSVSAFKTLFKFWSEKQIRRVLESLIEKKVVVVGNYNKSPYDQTRWFAFSDEWAYLLPETDPTQMGKSITPIRANHTTDSKPDKDIATPLHQPSLIKAEPSYKKFNPPTKPDCRVAAYEAGIPMEEGDKFWDHHNSAGWFLSRGRKMKEWRSAFSTWTRNHKKFESDKPKPKAKSIFIG